VIYIIYIYNINILKLIICVKTQSHFSISAPPAATHVWHSYGCAWSWLIRRPLPELERARLQLQSPMPSNPASQSLRILTLLEASEHPSIPDCSNPLFDHLKRMSLIRHRPPQGSTAGQTPSSPQPALALKPELPPLQECQEVHLTGIRASRHPSIQASGHRGRRQRR